MISETSEKRVIVIHGPNLNFLGKREPEVYGKSTLPEIDAALVHQGKALGFAVETFQSNHEGAIVDKIQASVGKASGLIINPGGFTHTSVAIRDALLILNIPIIEVHLSNIYKRESFRHQSFITDIATGQILGLGAAGYRLALAALGEMIP